jgi:hypothetical protein
LNGKLPVGFRYLHEGVIFQDRPGSMNQWGFGNNGIFTESSATYAPVIGGNGKITVYDANNMRQAIGALLSSGQWNDDSYFLGTHDCQNFAGVLRKQYNLMFGNRGVRQF